MGAFDPPNAAAHAQHHQQQITENSKIAARRTRLEMSGAHRDHSQFWVRLRLLGGLHARRLVSAETLVYGEGEKDVRPC